MILVRGGILPDGADELLVLKVLQVQWGQTADTLDVGPGDLVEVFEGREGDNESCSGRPTTAL